MGIPEPIETYLLRLGFEFRALRRDETAADALRRDPDAVWTRTVPVMADETPILVVVRAGGEIDEERLRRAAGVKHLRATTDQELAHYYPESEPGATPPLGHLYGQRVFLDDALTTARDLVVSAGTQADVICLRYADFAALVGPTIAHVSR